MNIELTTENLRKSCRVCLNQGDLNIWDHCVSLSENQDNCEETRNFELTAIELFKVFENYDTTLLGFNNELKLLCYSCLDELTNSFAFYKKAAQTNIKIQRLYNEAQKIEAEQLVEVVVEVLEHEFNNEENVAKRQNETHVDDLELIDETEAEVAIEDFVEQVSIMKENQFIEDDASELKVDANNTSHVEGVVRRSTTNLGICDKDLLEQNYIPLEETPTEEIGNKDQSQTCIIPQREKVTRTAVSKFPPDEDGSLVVTQFLPSTAHIVLEPLKPGENDNNASGGETTKSIPAPDLSTVDYAAVEVKRSNLQQIIEDELKLQSTEPSSQDCINNVDIYGNKEQVDQSANTVFVCQYCPQAFAAPHYLIAHVRKSRVCKYCTQAFTKSMDLFVHIRQAHHQHKCAICNKELSSHSNLRGHIKRVHGIRLPAQVALLDYRPPGGNTADDKIFSSMTGNNTIEEMDMYF